MPSATGGLEVMVDTKRVVRDRKRVTKSDIRPGTICTRKLKWTPWDKKTFPMIYLRVDQERSP